MKKLFFAFMVTMSLNAISQENSNQFIISKLFYRCLSFIFNFKLYMKYKLLKPILGKIVH